MGKYPKLYKRGFQLSSHSLELQDKTVDTYSYKDAKRAYK